MEKTIVQQDVQQDKESLEAKRVAEVSVKIIKKQLFRWLSKDTQKKVEHFLRFYHQEDRLTLLDAMMTYTMTGKKNVEVPDACCGDIVAVGKMDWKTGDTLTDSKDDIELPAIEVPEPMYSMAIAPKTKGQDHKVAAGLSKLNEEDISFSLFSNPETHQMVISGAGDIQIGVLCSKLKNLYNVETELLPARVAYREKIKSKVEAHGRHKKQSGGSGQFGDVWIRFEPQEEQDDMIFAEEVFGGSVPKNFFPSVEKVSAMLFRRAFWQDIRSSA